MFKKSIKTFFSKRKFNRTVFMVGIPITILGIFFFMVSLNNVYLKSYDIERFNRAKETIRSPITIENELETERKTRETVQAVEDRFIISEEVTAERLEYVEEIFEALDKQDEEMNENDIENSESSSINIHEDKFQQLKGVLSTEITESVNDRTLRDLIHLESSIRSQGKNVFLQSLEKILNNGVRTENIHSATEELKQSIKYTNLNSNMKDVLLELSEFAVVENAFFDVEKTMEARREAASNVDPVVIRAGEIIVREGQIITNEIYEELNLVGLLSNDRNFYPVIGLGLLILLILAVIAFEMNHLKKKNKLNKEMVASIVSISIIVVAMMKIVSLFTTQSNQLFYIVPIATGALLFKQLIHERIAIVFAILFSLLGSVIFNGEIPGALNMEVTVYFLFSQLASIIFLRNVKDRLAIIRSGIGIVTINIIIVLLFLFLSFEKYSLQDLFVFSGMAAASALLSAVLTIGLLPFFETGLGILSETKLISLASPNQPLLRKILTEAPGTYHHSIMVANLSETACEAIGANGLLARVGAYYHDIGKTIQPQYFIENQIAIKNPHDQIDPRKSAEIILRHPKDGANMLKKHRFPKEIIDIALEHHGKTLLKYFYYKEKETNEHVSKDIYRYPGPKPQSKEAAIICICDSVEAAVRSIKEPTEEMIEEIVESIISDRLKDGQFDETSLTMKELKTIQKAICESLKGIFHTRIQYPKKEAK